MTRGGDAASESCDFGGGETSRGAAVNRAALGRGRRGRRRRGRRRMGRGLEERRKMGEGGGKGRNTPMGVSWK